MSAHVVSGNLVASDGADESLQAGEPLYRLLAEMSADLITRHTLESLCLYASPASRALLGYEPEELLNRSFYDFVHPDDIDLARSSHMNVLTQPSRFQTVCRLRHKDGQFTWFEILSQMYKEPGEEGAISIVSVSRDITERLKAEQQRREHDAQLAHVTRLSTMGEMMAGIAHEICQPLSAIKNFAEASENALSGGSAEQVEQALEWVRIISEQSDRTRDIITGIRNFVRKSDSRRGPCDLHDLLRESVDLVASEGKSRGIRVHCQLPGLEPTVWADRIQIQQVVVNLLRNACEAIGQSDGISGRIWVDAQTDGNGIEVRVGDDGPGIPEKNLKQLFEPFFTTKSEGLGMGLAISRTIIEAHGGELWATQPDEGGTEFRFTLPLATQIDESKDS